MIKIPKTISNIRLNNFCIIHCKAKNKNSQNAKNAKHKTAKFSKNALQHFYLYEFDLIELGNDYYI